ncbi:MAG: fatty acid desaturase [Anaerolineales bacterium]
MSKTSSSQTSGWTKIVARYQTPEVREGFWQLFITLGPFVVMWALMYFSLRVSYALTLLLAFPTAGLLVRAFIIQHDCGHTSYFKSQKLNDIVGIIISVLTLTPYYAWRHGHAIHHATSGDLDRRGMGDVQTLTVAEYIALPWFRRLQYRILRHPAFMFLFGAPMLFLVLNRFPYKDDPRREKLSVHATTLAVAGLWAALCALVGWREFLLVHAPMFYISSVVGVWMFYIQHQFEDTYWRPHPDWDYVQASLQGSSFYKLPRVLQWFTGNIGFHHIHHLSPKIPFYRLETAYREQELFQHSPTLTLGSSFSTLSWRLWDEELGRMVGFARAAQLSKLQKKERSLASAGD